MATIRERLDAYVSEKYGIEPEWLPFFHEDYAVYRHTETGKWFAVFITKDRESFGLPGTGTAEIVSFKPDNQFVVYQATGRPGFLLGYPSAKWKWLSVVLDGTVSFEEICRWIDDSFAMTKSKTGNKKVPLLRKK